MHKKPTRTDLFAALCLQKGASEGSIKRAYREQVLKVHPDKLVDADQWDRVCTNLHVFFLSEYWEQSESVKNTSPCFVHRRKENVCSSTSATHTPP